MRVPLFWLHDYCDPGIGLTELEHRLTITGTKVEALHTHGVAALEHFLVGRVLTASQHPVIGRDETAFVDQRDGTRFGRTVDSQGTHHGAPMHGAGARVKRCG